jgi:hypothetical protein
MEKYLKKKRKYLEKPRGIGASRSRKDGACLKYMTVSVRIVTVDPVIVTPSARDVTLTVPSLTIMTSGLLNVKRRCYWRRKTQTVSRKWRAIHLRRLWRFLKLVYAPSDYWVSGLCPLKNTKFRWVRLDLSNGAHRVRVSHLLTWGRKQIQFPKRCVPYQGASVNRS